jgi:hypothetical protein
MFPLFLPPNGVESVDTGIQQLSVCKALAGPTEDVASPVTAPA